MIFDMMLDLLVVWNWKCPGTRYITVEVWGAFRYELMMSEYEKNVICLMSYILIEILVARSPA